MNLIFRRVIVFTSLITNLIFFEGNSFAGNYKFPKKTSITSTVNAGKLSREYSLIADRVSKAVVYIHTAIDKTKLSESELEAFEKNDDPKKYNSQGSGFIFDLKKGYIITNAHVVEKALKIEVRLSDGNIYTTELVGLDSETDIAVIKIEDEKIFSKRLRTIIICEF